MIIEELVDEFDHLRLGLHLLRGGFGILCGQCLGLASLEADMKGGRSFRWQFHERDILDDVREEPFALAVRQARIMPKRFEVCCHGGQSIADRVVDGTPVLPLAATPFLLCVGESAQFVIPFAFERIRDETVTGIDQRRRPDLRRSPGDDLPRHRGIAALCLCGRPGGDKPCSHTLPQRLMLSRPGAPDRTNRRRHVSPLLGLWPRSSPVAAKRGVADAGLEVGHKPRDYQNGRLVLVRWPFKPGQFL